MHNQHQSEFRAEIKSTGSVFPQTEAGICNFFISALFSSSSQSDFTYTLLTCVGDYQERTKIAIIATLCHNAGSFYYNFQSRIGSNNLIILPNALPRHTGWTALQNRDRGEVKNTIQFKIH